MKWISVLLFSTTLVSCGNNGNTKNEMPPLPQQTQQSPVLNTTTDENTQQAQTQQPASTSTAGLNPAHGLPGHRCDIAVGAPLNSNPNTQTNTPAITTTAAPVTVTQPQAPVQQATPGMNPQHGQPGHRCDIAVGAPLNTPATSTTQNPPPYPYPAKPDSTE